MYVAVLRALSTGTLSAVAAAMVRSRGRDRRIVAPSPPRQDEPWDEAAATQPSGTAEPAERRGLVLDIWA
jgi:hypothetical protein